MALGTIQWEVNIQSSNGMYPRAMHRCEVQRHNTPLLFNQKVKLTQRKRGSRGSLRETELEPLDCVNPKFPLISGLAVALACFDIIAAITFLMQRTFLGTFTSKGPVGGIHIENWGKV